jgi:hypothetical protein
MATGWLWIESKSERESLDLTFERISAIRAIGGNGYPEEVVAMSSVRVSALGVARASLCIEYLGRMRTNLTAQSGPSVADGSLPRFTRGYPCET